METVLERFMRYVSFDTQSDEDSATVPTTAKQKLLGAALTVPTTAKQKLLGAALVEEMQQMGIADARMDEYGYVYGTVPGDPSLPTIGLIAHMDTSPDASGADIKARVTAYDGGDICLNEQLGIYLRESEYESLKAHMDTSPDASGADIKARVTAYDGGDICLNEQLGIYLRESEYESLKNHHGKHLVVTDGTTLLGADDKAGIAEILPAAQTLLNQGGRHATLKIGFTPDEEVGSGADHFDVAGFAADYAYTADGGTLGELEYENFNAAGASPRTRRWAAAQTTSTWRASPPTMPTPPTAAPWGSWNTKTSTPPERKRRWAAAQTTSTWRASPPTMPTPPTAAPWGSWNTKTSTPPERKSPSTD